jgi:glycosyltransferase involved in cell wall biosynthesis
MNTVPILFAHCGLDWITGSERCLLDLVENLDRDRFRPVVVCNGTSLAAAAEKLGARVYCGARFGEEHSHLLPNRALIREAGRIVKEHEIRLIHANDFQPIAWLLPIARSSCIPIVLHVHLPTTREERYFTWSHQVARVVGVSRTALQGFLDDGLPAKRATVIYNAVDPARLSIGDATAVRAELGLGDSVVLTAVGSLIRRKGFDILLRAYAQVRSGASAASRVNARLLFVGDGPDRQELEALATSLGLGDSVRFLGRRTDVPAILAASDIALSAAREEGLPLNVLEAGFFGLPTVLSDIAPHREVIEHGRTGLIAAAEDVTAFASAIARLLADPATRRRLGEAAGEHIRSNFLMDRYVRQFSALYQELLENPARTYGWFGGWVWPRAYNEWIRRAGHRRLSYVGRVGGISDHRGAGHNKEASVTTLTPSR